GQAVADEYLSDRDHGRVLEGEHEGVVDLGVFPQSGEVVEAREPKTGDRVSVEECVSEGPHHRDQHHDRVDDQSRTHEGQNRPLVTENLLHGESLSAVWGTNDVPPPYHRTEGRGRRDRTARMS